MKLADRLNQLDRRYIFLAMLLAVAVPLLAGIVFPEQPSLAARSTFEQIENLPEGSKVLISFDYDLSSAAELAPMATGFVRHCCMKRHKMYLTTFWPTGSPMVDLAMRNIIEGEFRDAGFKYGVDYVHLGYQQGEAVGIKAFCEDITTNRKVDNAGKGFDALPMMEEMANAGQFDLIAVATAGYPGGKEWVQYGRSKYDLKLVAGCTGVQGPQLEPYFPVQIKGLLKAIKGAAEYESLLTSRYPKEIPASKNSAMLRMGPQMFAHLLIVGLILLGNWVHLFRSK